MTVSEAEALIGKQVTACAYRSERYANVALVGIIRPDSRYPRAQFRNTVGYEWSVSLDLIDWMREVPR